VGTGEEWAEQTKENPAVDWGLGGPMGGKLYLVNFSTVLLLELKGVLAPSICPNTLTFPPLPELSPWFPSPSSLD